MSDVSFQLGIDIGGTFTDLSLLALDGGASHTHKVASTPSAPSRAVARGIRELMSSVGSAPDAISYFVHGQTIALNAVLERRGARSALIVSAGNGDILEIARLRKKDIFNLKASLPSTIVARQDVYEIPVRGDDADASAGLAAIDAVIAQLAPEVESVAICLLGAYNSDAVERQLAERIRETRPDLYLSCSSDLWSEIREYERASVASLNAYVQPIMSRYVDNLVIDTQEVGLDTALQITQSNGGVLSASSAKAKPVNTMLSGPASGVVAAAYVAGLSGVGDAVTLDIGGTSADFSIIRDEEPVYSTDAEIGDFPIVMPTVDVFAVGAGGGSIAWFDPFGILKLGPQSAGAEPGPACYNRGGTEATVTDAYLVAGYIDAGKFAGGSLSLKAENAFAAVGRIAERLGCSAEDASEAILRLGTATMTSAILPMMTKRGLDPRDFTLIAFGGAGPTHACLLAEEVGIGQILVPPSPGTMCALGATIADYQYNYIRSLRKPLTGIDADTMRAIYGELEQEGRDALAAENPMIERIEIVRSANMRYAGQAFDVDVTLPADLDIGALTPERLAEAFHDTYEALYHNSERDAAVDLVSLRVRVFGRRAKPSLPPARQRDDAGGLAAIGTRPIYHGGQAHEASVYRREDFCAGDSVAGPAVVEQFDTTTVVTPGFTARCDAAGNLLLTNAKREKRQ
ncbi:hydantoinase/oxoprolinase family protein [Salipiger abyssi]|uniref:hydantoinase/oxoprolinase family protein n=1 Tax=Salipiger abyssi TaxID=1250539 RepID=UPI001A906240|nr:hydantoinase/oxoprolinase family protein [Salipiger abyssi]MBN9888294.1 hydantoinase/oxoprolinase family protein [Salipiger abyssi]